MTKLENTAPLFLSEILFMTGYTTGFISKLTIAKSLFRLLYPGSTNDIHKAIHPSTFYGFDAWQFALLIFGTLYPAYASYKAVRTKNVREYVKWMMYWIVFALFTCAETFTDLFLSFWFPFYYEIKIITVIYLLSPATKGSSILYRKFVHPVLTKREQEIDEYIAKAKEQGYHTMLNLGSKGVNYATSLIMQTAIKGGGGLVNQLRKSYSLSDLREEEDGSVTDGGGPGPIRRIQAQNSGQILPENYGGFYSTVGDFYQRPVDRNREMFFPDDMSSGYSSGDNMYFNKRPSKEEVLVRTASLGPSSRTRARAVTKNGLPKRASLSEGGSTRSALEPLESQNETENFSSSFSHSTSYPSLTSFPPYFAHEYRDMYDNVILNQLFAFITHQQSQPQVLDNRTAAFQNTVGDSLGCPNVGTSGNPSVCISEVNSDNSGEVDLKGDASEVAGQVETNSSENITLSPPAESKNNETEKKLAEAKYLEEVETAKENFLLSDSSDGQEKMLQKKSGKYKKKPAPTPPTEQPLSKSMSSLIVEDEESEFFTPNASPVSSRKPSISSHDMLPGSSNADVVNKSKARTSTTREVEKKNKTKKRDIIISKKLVIPKMSFSFWHHKTGKQASSSDSCSVASAESTFTRSEPQSDTEFFIPLKDEDENEKEEHIGRVV